MTLEQFHALVYDVFSFFKKFIPYDTGNLCNNAFRLEYVSPTEIKLYIDPAIAPYMPYTNEPWISPRWNGKKNPNEHWWQDTVELIVRYIAEQYKGVVEVVK